MNTSITVLHLRLQRIIPEPEGQEEIDLLSFVLIYFIDFIKF